jgi:methylthioribose-1-phosphate isomerase
MTSATQIYPVIWKNNKVLLIDQTRLPGEYAVVEINRSEDMARAIEMMIVRGGSAIGVAAAYGLYLGAREIQTSEPKEFLKHLEAVAQSLRQTCPTTVNLFWAMARMLRTAYEATGSIREIQDKLLETAQQIQTEDLQTCQAIGEQGLSILPEMPRQLTLLTHGNAGALASAGYGTALGVIRSAWANQRLARVYVDETRPRLQGAKLTAWECVQDQIPVTIITDSMAAWWMQQGKIDAVVVGADQIAANGDVANQIGTYAVAIAAKAHNVPFFVAAPLSTVDFERSSGEQIPLEEQTTDEIDPIPTTLICPTGAEFDHPAFDITPARLITALITERGAFKPEELIQFQPQSSS